MVLNKLKQSKLSSIFFNNTSTVKIAVKHGHNNLTEDSRITVEGNDVEKENHNVFRIADSRSCTLNVTHNKYKSHIQTFTVDGDMTIQVNLQPSESDDGSQSNSMEPPVVDPSIDQIERYTEDSKLVDALNQYHEDITHLLEDRVVFAVSDPSIQYMALCFEKRTVERYDTDIVYHSIVRGENVHPFNSADVGEEVLSVTEKSVSPKKAIKMLEREQRQI